MNRGDRLRVTLLDRMSTVENSKSSVTLEDVLMADISISRPQLPSPPPPSFTMTESPARNSSLLKVMRRDRRRDKTTWKSLCDKLRLKRTTTAWISSNHILSLDTPILTPDNDSNRFNRLGFLLSNSETNLSSGGAEEAAERDVRLWLGAVLAEEREEVQLPRMSLMELLDENDGPMYVVSDRGEAAEEGMTTMTTAMLTTSTSSGCCVCMIRSKGAAFIPCGHTICRLCSRELWMQRGNCRYEVQLQRMSLMELLDDNDGPMYDVSDRGEEAEEGTTTMTTAMLTTSTESGCCMCMIRSKAAAFIPCGHTFCRLCSRELWMQRGNCPLCNSSIIQVLDIF